MKIMLALSAAAMVLPTVTFAQAQMVMQPATTNVLRTGTPVSLRMVQAVTTKEKAAKVNDRVRLEVAEAITVNGVVVIPAGSPAVAELTEVRNKGMWGKSGFIAGRVLTVNANGRTIRLSGAFDTKGGSGTGGAVAVSALVFLPAGFFMTGKSAEMPAGTIVRGFIDEDIPLAFAPSAAPMSVPAAPAQAAPMVVK